MSQSLLKIAADFTVQLASAVAIGDTTATLSSIADDDSVSLPSGLYGFTIDNGQSNKEYIICTLTGTALTDIKSISRQGAVTTGFTKNHRRGGKVSITDWVILKRILDNLNGTTGFDSGVNLGYDGTPTGLTGNQFATVNYVLSVVNGGTVTFDEQVISNQVAGENLTANDIVYFKESDQKWYKSDADTLATVEGVFLGISKSVADENDTMQVAISGPISGFSGLTAGAKYYVSNTAGGVSTTPGTNAVFIGWALTTSTILMNVKSFNTPTINEKNAMVGGGSFGTPGSTNKFLTEQYGVVGTFGGDGSDGVLNVTSGTTTIDLGNADVVVKNYTSINISSGATVNFSNPNNNGTKIILKSQGNVTIAGTLDASGMGSASASQPNGVLGTETVCGLDGDTTPGAQLTLRPFYAATKYSVLSGFAHIIPGAGGGRGGHGNTSGGAGGRGGGAILIECKKTLNFTGIINTSGMNGGDSANATNDSSGGGGGGGSAGMCLVLYNTIATNSGTINASGGNGGKSGSNNDGSTSGSPCEGGGGGGSYYGAGGSDPGGGGGGLGAGGAGARGIRGINFGGNGGAGGASMGGLIMKNTMFS